MLLGEAAFQTATRRAAEFRKRVEVLTLPGAPLRAFADSLGVGVGEALDQLTALTYTVAKSAPTALGQEAMEALASIVGHSRLGTLPGGGEAVARTIVSNVFYAREAVLERVLTALQAPAAGGKRMVDVDNAGTVLRGLSTANNRGTAYPIVVASDKFSGRVRDLEFRRRDGLSDVDILLDDAFVEVKNKGRLVEDDFLQLRDKVLPEYLAIDPTRKKLLVINPVTRDDDDILNSIRGLGFSVEVGPSFPVP